MSARLTYHQKMEEGLSPSQISELYGVTEFEVVKVLRSSSPKIKGVSYSHLKLPIPQEEIDSHYRQGTLSEYADTLGVSAGTLQQRVSAEAKSSKKEGNTRSSKYKREVTEEIKDRFMLVYARTHNVSQSAKETDISMHFAKKIIEERSDKLPPSTVCHIFSEMFKLVAEEKLDARYAYNMSNLIKRLPVESLAQEGMLFRWLREDVITFSEAEMILNILEAVP